MEGQQTMQHSTLPHLAQGIQHLNHLQIKITTFLNITSRVFKSVLSAEEVINTMIEKFQAKKMPKLLGFKFMKIECNYWGFSFYTKVWINRYREL